MSSLRFEGRLFASVEPNLHVGEGDQKASKIGVRTHNAFIGFFAAKMGKAVRCDLGEGVFRYVNINSLRNFVARNTGSIPEALTKEGLQKCVEQCFKTIRNDPQASVSSEGLAGKPAPVAREISSLFAQTLQHQLLDFSVQSMRVFFHKHHQGQPLTQAERQQISVIANQLLLSKKPVTEEISLSTFETPEKQDEAIAHTLDRVRLQVEGNSNPTSLIKFRSEIQAQVEKIPGVPEGMSETFTRQLLLGVSHDSKEDALDSMLVACLNVPFKAAGVGSELSAIRATKMLRDREGSLVVENTRIYEHKSRPGVCFVATRRSQLTQNSRGEPVVKATVTWENTTPEALLKKEYEESKKPNVSIAERNEVKKRIIHNHLAHILDPADRTDVLGSSPSALFTRALGQMNVFMDGKAYTDEPSLTEAVAEKVLDAFPDIDQGGFVEKIDEIRSAIVNTEEDLMSKLNEERQEGDQVTKRPTRILKTEQGILIESSMVLVKKDHPEQSHVFVRRVLVKQNGPAQMELTSTTESTAELLMKEYLESQRSSSPSEESAYVRKSVQERVKNELFPLLLQRATVRSEGEMPDLESEIEALGKKFSGSDLDATELERAKKCLNELQSFAGNWRRETKPSLGAGPEVEEATRRLSTATEALADAIHLKHSVVDFRTAVHKKAQINAARVKLHKKCMTGIQNLISQIKCNSSPLSKARAALPKLQALLADTKSEFLETLNPIVQELLKASGNMPLAVFEAFQQLRRDVADLVKSEAEGLSCAQDVEAKRESLGSDVAAELRDQIVQEEEAKITLREAQDARSESILKTFGRQGKELQRLGGSAQPFSGGAQSASDEGLLSFRSAVDDLVRQKSGDDRRSPELAETLLLGACIDAFPHLKHPKEMMDTLVSPCMAGGQSVLVPSMIEGAATIPLSVRETPDGVEVLNRTLYHLRDPSGKIEDPSAYCLTIRSILRRNESGVMEQSSEISWKKVV